MLHAPATLMNSEKWIEYCRLINIIFGYLCLNAVISLSYGVFVLPRVWKPPGYPPQTDMP